MSDTVGALQLPLATPGTPVTVALTGPDPACVVLAAFARAITNAVCGALYSQGDKDAARTATPVWRAFTHDPRDVELLETDLPALFVWRDGDSDYRQVAAGYRVVTSTVNLLWVEPSDRQEYAVRRYPFPNALAKNIDRAIELGRDPSFRVVGDTDPQADTLGSTLLSLADLWSLRMQQWRRIPVANSETKEPYRGVLATLELKEQLTYSLGRYGDLTYIEGTLRTPDAGMGDGGKILGVFHEER